MPEDNGDALDDVRSVRDTDYSITGIDAQGDVVTVVSPAPLLLTNDCSVRKNWNWAYCQHTYTKVSMILRAVLIAECRNSSNLLHRELKCIVSISKT